MLDRLVGRPVLAEADRIVGRDEDHPLPHQGGEPQRRPAIVGEHQEGAAVGDDAAVHRHAVHGGDHAVLAHAVVDVAAAIGRPVAIGAVAAVLVRLECVRSAEPPTISGTAAVSTSQRHLARLAAWPGPAARRTACACRR